MKFSNRKVGGIRFLKLGRLNVSFSVSKPAPKVAKVETRKVDFDLWFGHALACIPLAGVLSIIL